MRGDHSGGAQGCVLRDLGCHTEVSGLGPAACKWPSSRVFSFLFTVKAIFVHEKILKQYV